MTEEYLTTEELASRLKLRPKSVRNKMASGVFKKGIHFFSPQGLGPRFKWSAVVTWLEKGQERIGHEEADLPPLRLMGKF